MLGGAIFLGSGYLPLGLGPQSCTQVHRFLTLFTPYATFLAKGVSPIWVSIFAVHWVPRASPLANPMIPGGSRLGNPLGAFVVSSHFSAHFTIASIDGIIPRMSTTLLAQTETTPFLFARTKLRPPRPRGDTLQRPRLVATLQQAVANARLALVSAPAGYGKTTLVANAVSQLPNTRVVWLTVDGEDDEPLRFLSAFTAALQPITPPFAHAAAGILAGAGQGDQRDPILLGRAVMTALINELFEDETPLCLVIDDLHYVTNEHVHAALNFLIDRLPSTVTVVIATRHDPPLTLAQLRAKREMVELRLEELRFSEDEAIALLQQQVGLRLNRDEITALMQRTDGWVAGMILLSASLSRIDSAKARSAFLTQLQQSNRYIFDYLAEAVFAREEASTQAFLVATALLDELSVAVCAAVSQRPDAEQILADLYRRNLFLIGAEMPGQLSYRYHDLFRDFLQERARREPAERLREWHVRAAQAIAQPARKVHHFLLGNAWDEAADVIEQVAPALIQQGWANLVRRWIRQLPATLVDQRPRLAYWLGVSAFADWDMHEARRWLTQARAGLHGKGRTAEETTVLLELALCLAGMTLNDEAAQLLAEIDERPLTLVQQIQMGAVKLYLALERADAPQILATGAALIAAVEKNPEPAALTVLAVTMHYPWLMEPGGLPNIERLAKLYQRHASQNPMLEAMAHLWFSRAARLRGDWEKAIDEMAKAQAISQRVGGSFNITSEAGDNGVSLAFLGRAAEADQAMAAWLTELRVQNSWSVVWSALPFYLYANARWNQGRDGECAALYQEMLAAINPSQRAYSVVMREMVRGLLQLTAGNYTDAAETFYGASTHPHAMPSLVHHSQTMLAHTYYLQGKDDQALELFTPVLAVYAAEQTPGAIRIMGPAWLNRCWHWRSQAIAMPILPAAFWRSSIPIIPPWQQRPYRHPKPSQQNLSTSPTRVKSSPNARSKCCG